MAMTYADNSDLFIAAALNDAIVEGLVDRTSLLSTISYLGSVNGKGSLAGKQPVVLWDDPMSAANVDEVTLPSPVDLGTSAPTVTVARQVLVRQITDLYEIAGGPRPGVEAFAQQMIGAATMRATDMIAALFAGFSSAVNKGGQQFQVDHLYDGLYKLIAARAGGPKHAVLSPTQLAHFLDSLRAEGQSLVPVNAANNLQFAGEGWGLHGEFGGVMIWSSDSVATDTGNSVGAIYAQNAIGYKDGVPESVVRYANPESFAGITPEGSPIFVEFQRSARGGHTDVVGNYYFGCAEILDTAGVKLISTATL